MSRGTGHNVHNRARQRASEEATYKQHDPVLQRIRRIAVAAAADRRRGRLDLCNVCKEFFRSNSSAVGVFVCPTCRSQVKQ
jgi:hypothetical protein